MNAVLAIALYVTEITGIVNNQVVAECIDGTTVQVEYDKKQDANEVLMSLDAKCREARRND